MSSQRHQPTHEPPGKTTGTPDRPAQVLAAAVMPFDLAQEAARLRTEPAWLDGDRNAKTLVKETDVRVVLTALKAGARLAHHETVARFALQMLSGRVRLDLLGTTMELGESQMLVLDPDIRHGVEAIEESVVLLTLVWPAGGAEPA